MSVSFKLSNSRTIDLPVSLITEVLTDSDGFVSIWTMGGRWYELDIEHNRIDVLVAIGWWDAGYGAMVKSEAVS